MIAPRLLERKIWEKLLSKEHGCKKDSGGENPPIETGEWWLTSHDFLFIVPCERDGRLRTDDLQRVVVEIARLKPLDLE